MRWDELPIAKITCTKNNTIMRLIPARDDVRINDNAMAHWSCSMEGFKNAKKKTNIAAQASALTFGKHILDQGIKNVRVLIAGLGPGRMSALKGIELTGINIVSITDKTPFDEHPRRPRKARRL